MKAGTVDEEDVRRTKLLTRATYRIIQGERRKLSPQRIPNAILAQNLKIDGIEMTVVTKEGDMPVFWRNPSVHREKQHYL